MGTAVLQVHETYARGYRKALSLAKRTVKHTPLPPEELIVAMLNAMIEQRTLVHTVGDATFRLVDFMPDYIERKDKNSETTVDITVPLPIGLHELMSPWQWQVTQDIQNLMTHERAAEKGIVAQYPVPVPVRIMAAGFRFFAATRTAEWQHAVGLKTPRKHKPVNKQLQHDFHDVLSGKPKY